jgi:hypothetical protein
VIQLDVDLEWLLKVRVAVARCGEMDCAQWWNTNGQLGSLGATVLARGFPRTHHFAQARSVFAAATAKCAETFALPGSMTLWWLGEDLEEAFDLEWEAWLDRASEWRPFFEEVANSMSADLSDLLLRLQLVTPDHIERAASLRPDASGKGVRVPADTSSTRDQIALLALGFVQGAAGKPVVPYAVIPS